MIQTARVWPRSRGFRRRIPAGMSSQQKIQHSSPTPPHHEGNMSRTLSPG